MTFKLRRLRLRALTEEGWYGAEIGFVNGLNVLWADNTMGKSTCIQGMLYVLGLERMLSPRREIPLPHAMTSYLTTDSGKNVKVLESDVTLEMENSAGTIVTINRPVISKLDDRLVTVQFGPALSDAQGQFRIQRFFVRDPGAAQREDGFHHFLENFLGWELPIVRGYEKDEIKLYLETVFPLFWVEQKSGWSSIPAAIPTYFRIREVHKRAVEFIAGLEAYNIERKREQLNQRLNALTGKWELRWLDLSQHLARAGSRIEAVSQKPTADTDSLASGFISVATTAGWVSLDDHIKALKTVLSELSETAVPTIADNVPEIEAKLADVTAQAEGLNIQRLSIHGISQLKTADVDALQRRIQSLKEDLAKNQDVQKLQRFSGVQWSLTPDRCPTCEQALQDTLLSQNALAAIMPIEDNITYIKSELRMFEDILQRENEEEREREGQLSQLNRDLSEAYSRIRTLRADLISTPNSLSASAVEERVLTERKIKDFADIQTVFDDAIAAFSEMSEDYIQILQEKSSLPEDELSDSDKSKLQRLSELLRDQARQFGFITFKPEDLSISTDTYRPEKEGFEIGFETSASDAIRLKWAYQLGLLELTTTHATNHPGVLVFDEPRQQSSSKISFEQLLIRAATAKHRGQQVIFSTSEDLSILNPITDRIDCAKIVFEGHVLQPLAMNQA
ncbi:hypothetical protein HJB53_04785 [Rhizobium lentis]|uniref:hypothetical protein n=1 Tax=Rhizobium lentis TaxID=1138194 RepID=UPI001C83071F|nr:hypothetical protein [Rhizobium lentis]MBX4957342.1 hypothetical protein [Rhizobium lentis]MBX4987333.1 hypothetical protein [Rhizobium lentis]MBX5005777.1 hypothetical protein [Rhizobium lentis]MBX5027041.1 hypothetical protein [Rhizobium lentis]MBX5033884.1 hypothetical protein [Rhizobium lentis]